MMKKGSDFFEKHVEKIILGIVGLVCVWLLVTRVLLSPNYVEYDNKKCGCGDIDFYISERAVLLENKLNRKPEPKEAYKPRFGDFLAFVNSAIPNIDTSLSPPQPTSTEIIVRPVYRIPSVGNVDNVGVEHIRAVAYVPTERIDEENLYVNAENEPNDLDFVTVEAKFDVAQLYESFYETFAGNNVKEEWRDPRLAKPVFAAVQLLRQEQLADAGLSGWQIVPRTKIDHRKRMFEIIEEIENLPAGGMQVRMLRFDDVAVMMDLLQPEAYCIASAEKEWFPPSLHKEFVKNQKEIEAREKLEAKAAKSEEREREREQARSERERTRSRQRTETRATSSPAASDISPMLQMMKSGGPSVKKTAPKRTRRDRSARRKERESDKERLTRSKDSTKKIDDFYDELNKIMIADKIDFSKMREPLVFWAHDDTVEPGTSYRYKIRLGVFNPIAGTERFSEQDRSQKDKAILWSKFSDVTETVKIPEVLYFFPLEIQEAAKRVTVQVSRYVLGYWYRRDFMVNSGEVIGEVVEYEPDEEETSITVPESIDYSTKAVLVDVRGPVKDWSGGNNLRARRYFNMLYSFDGETIEHMPIRPRYWADAVQAKFNQIKKSAKEPKKPLQDCGRRAERGRRVTTPGQAPESLEEHIKKMMERIR